MNIFSEPETPTVLMHLYMYVCVYLEYNLFISQMLCSFVSWLYVF